MKSYFLTNYTILSLFLAFVCCIVGARALCKKSRIGNFLALTCFVSAFVNVTYLASIILTDYFHMSLAASLYFIGIDWVLISLFSFCRLYIADQDIRLLDRLDFRILLSCASVETILFLINPFKEISVSYLYRDTAFATYEYQMHAPYYFHLFLTYFMVFYTMFLFLHKAFHTPVQYRRRYSLIALILIFIVLLNAVFLYIPGTQLLNLLDVSTCFYCAAVILIYWSCFIYGESATAKALSSFVLTNIDQGIVLFDYTDHLVLKNERADVLMHTDRIKDNISLKEFLEICHLQPFPARKEDELDHFTVQCTFDSSEDTVPVRCDYRRITDGSTRIIGRMFVFTDTALETDLLTGFQSLKSFKKFIKENPHAFPYPVTFTAIDISNLSILNSTFGSDFGDRKITELSGLMKNYFPKSTYFIREEDAILVAICSYVKEDDIRTYIKQIREHYDLIFHYAIHTHTNPSQSVSDGIRTAISGMKNRKILDAGSTHSSVLNSLLRALEETDSDTEAHVRRTRSMGAELGIRIGLSDVDQSNLSLLCVLHDIGKIGIPLEILNKPGTLTPEEWELLKTHTEKGYQIALSSPAFAGIAEMILYHHERWDGNGYPNGLSRESIPLLSRIISVVDAYDAMVNDRSYRKGMPYDQACETLRQSAGTQFDPYIVSEFLQMIKECPQFHHFDSTEESVPAAAEDALSIYPSDGREVPQAVSDRPSDAPVPRSLNAPGSARTNFAVHPMTYSKYLLNKDHQIIRVDGNFELLTGYTAEDVQALGMKQQDLIPLEDRTEYLVQINGQLADSGIAYIEHQLQKKDGSIIYVYCIGEVYYDSAAQETRSQIMIVDSMKTYTMQTLAEIEHTKARERMRHWEDTYRRDSLTGLLNRAAFQRDVEFRLLGDSAIVMMLMMDLDRFKDYNDTYGHNAGDELLVLLSHTLADSLREEDLSCRMGGDEFAAALFFKKDTTEDALLHRARQIFDRINMTMSAVSEHTSLSMGIVIRNTGNASFNHLYQEADRALYRSKNDGRARMTIADRDF